jgi:spermidine synthase
MSASHGHWLHENFTHTGSAFGLRIKRKLEEVQSPFQKIEMYESTDWGNVMLIDGAMMVTTRDNFFYHEMMAHAPLYTHPAPREVVIIGGGDCGTLREVLRHSEVTRAVQCDIDEQVTRMAEKYFPELCESNADPRATVMFDDGLAYMSNAAPNSIDLVIVDSTDPVGPAEGLFNRAFYENCLKALRPDGLLVQQSESPLALMHLIIEMRDAMREAGFKDFRVLPFPQPCYPTGWWSCLIASKQARDLTQFRKADAAAKRFDTHYYTADVHQGALAMPPLLQRALG